MRQTSICRVQPGSIVRYHGKSYKVAKKDDLDIRQHTSCLCDPESIDLDYSVHILIAPGNAGYRSVIVSENVLVDVFL